MWRRVDLVLRFIYILLAPAMLVALAMQMPIAGIVASTAIATAVALFGADRWQASVGRIPVIGRFLAGMARLGDYYEDHPPKPLLYYIAYPILFPYWLWNRVARREFLVYRKLNGLAVVVIVGMSAYDYLRHWRPIPFSFFLGTWIATFVFQLLVTFALVMPIVTTIIAYHQRGLRKTLVLVFVATSLVAVGTAFAALRNNPVSTAAQMRINARSIVERDRAVAAFKRALDAASRSFAAAPDDRDAALDVARAELREVYQPDEVAAFRVLVIHGIVIVYVPFRHKPTIWLARTPDGKYFSRPDLLPADLRFLIGV